DMNARLGAIFHAIHDAALRWQATGKLYGNNAPLEFVAQMGRYLSDVADQLVQIDRNLGAAVAELKSVWEHPGMDGAMVRNMWIFPSFFGRETIYVSFTHLRNT